MHQPSFSLRNINREKGQVTTLMLLVVILCFILVGFVIDIANAYFSHKRLQNIADMSAMAVGDQASRDAVLQNDPQKLENLLREIISRNAQMSRMPIATGDVQINVYQNDPEKLFDIQLTKNTSPLLFKTLPFDLKASATYGTPPSTLPVAVLFVVSANFNGFHTQVRTDVINSVNLMISQLKPGDYAGVNTCPGNSTDLVPLSNQSDIDKFKLPSTFPGWWSPNESPHGCLRYGRASFERLKTSLPSAKWEKMSKILIYMGTAYPYYLESINGWWSYGNLDTRINSSHYFSGGGWHGTGQPWEVLINALGVQQSDFARDQDIQINTIFYNFMASYSYQRQDVMKRIANVPNYVYGGGWLLSSSGDWRYWYPYYNHTDEPRHLTKFKGQSIVLGDFTSTPSLIQRAKSAQTGLIN